MEIEDVQNTNEPENVKEEEVEESFIPIANEVVADIIFSKVFQQIDEKIKIESKRKTWNKIRKEEKKI